MISDEFYCSKVVEAVVLCTRNMTAFHKHNIPVLQIFLQRVMPIRILHQDANDICVCILKLSKMIMYFCIQNPSVALKYDYFKVNSRKTYMSRTYMNL